MTRVLDVQNLEAFYENAQALFGVDLHVESGEIVALLGRNGAGKTTTIRSITGTMDRTEGDIEFHGDSIAGLSSDEVFNRGISWIPERRRVFRSLTVEENLQMGRRGDTGDDPYRMVFDLFPILKERRNQRAGTMSGGQQQMLAIARALLSDPDLILVDEPLEGLMPTLVIDILEVFTELKQQNMTMVIAEQQTDQVLELAERAYIIDKGTIAYEGTAEDLKSDRGLMEQHMGVK
jgi:branched-chain amino acid transport system ATP-binding protein